MAAADLLVGAAARAPAPEAEGHYSSKKKAEGHYGLFAWEGVRDLTEWAHGSNRRPNKQADFILRPNTQIGKKRGQISKATFFLGQINNSPNI